MFGLCEGSRGMVMHYKSWEKRGNGETAAGITEAHKVRGFFNLFFYHRAVPLQMMTMIWWI